ncbi:hypothetical protein EHYA_08444 [Embleya hyalina]|uniref:Uncharacterized protein n=1 Tax=Embleya hyalina TaxID=516124 RepID=A0A401Z1K2_9ACTN|nr:hypothetical protein EHYA_08444 [Embleya hyalina]
MTPQPCRSGAESPATSSHPGARFGDRRVDAAAHARDHFVPVSGQFGSGSGPRPGKGTGHSRPDASRSTVPTDGSPGLRSANAVRSSAARSWLAVSLGPGSNKEAGRGHRHALGHRLHHRRLHPAPGRRRGRTLRERTVHDGHRVDCLAQPVPDDRGGGSLWLYTADTGHGHSVAAAAGYTPNTLQSEPRRLWDEVETAWRWWDGQQRPTVPDFGLTATIADTAAVGQVVWCRDRDRRTDIERQHA